MMCLKCFPQFTCAALFRGVLGSSQHRRLVDGEDGYSIQLLIYVVLDARIRELLDAFSAKQNLLQIALNITDSLLEKQLLRLVDLVHHRLVSESAQLRLKLQGFDSSSSSFVKVQAAFIKLGMGLF
jgi:hypothetical protein